MVLRLIAGLTPGEVAERLGRSVDASTPSSTAPARQADRERARRSAGLGADGECRALSSDPRRA